MGTNKSNSISIKPENLEYVRRDTTSIWVNDNFDRTNITLYLHSTYNLLIV